MSTSSIISPLSSNTQIVDTLINCKSIDKRKVLKSECSYHIPMTPPRRKQSAWMARTMLTMMASFRPDKFSRIDPPAPAIFTSMANSLLEKKLFNSPHSKSTRLRENLRRPLTDAQTLRMNAFREWFVLICWQRAISHFDCIIYWYWLEHFVAWLLTFFIFSKIPSLTSFVTNLFRLSICIESMYFCICVIISRINTQYTLAQG